ncbi:E3 ubiquitin-protein ligase ATL4 [Zea mays]|uniref:Putative RING zinc finger domain superfamily protein n=1 Tax=Zea mays TaxID=4577 RepID=K7VXV8_MAIZE|nr:E3 ubiquitin-protein ligase ATL4 [Zea mays]AQL05536.1 Putative RING zinc finger domain superfamily protein [Zea mays]|eukprot:XP_008659920.1 E3 ubiquitin-protein ligase ATL4 [Zea mays]
MASTAIPSPPPPAVPERRVPLVPRLADDGGGDGRGDARGSSAGGGGSGSGSVAGISPSILVIAVIVVVMLLASLCIHYFIRHLCRHVGPAGSSSSSSSLSRQAPPLPLVARPAAGASVAPADGQGGGGKAAAAAEAEAERLIARLPQFTLSSSLAAVPKSSRDCAVCQTAFRDDDGLRLLPACRHAFHSRCVDPWLRANPSCPLCRASIALPHPPLTDLLRVELGSVSSRRSNPDAAAAAVRAYPLPGGLPDSASSEYLVEEELQVVLKPTPPAAAGSSDPTSQQQQQLAAVERGQPTSSVGLTPTASFRSTAERWSSRWSNRWSSRWSSGRWSNRYDAGTVTAAATAEWWWDMDGGVAPPTRRRDADDGSASFYGFVRWLTGAY